MIDETMKKSWEEKGCCLFAEAGSLGSFTPSKAGKGEARPVLKPSGGEAAMSGGNISVSSDSCEQNVIYWTSLLYCMTAKVMSSACRCQLQCLVGRGDGVGQGGGVGGGRGGGGREGVGMQNMELLQEKCQLGVRQYLHSSTSHPTPSPASTYPSNHHSFLFTGVHLTSLFPNLSLSSNSSPLLPPLE